jgi:hypothetical protein
MQLVSTSDATSDSQAQQVSYGADEDRVRQKWMLYCMIEAVRSAKKTIDIDNVNRVLLQPHWQKEWDLIDQ